MALRDVITSRRDAGMLEGIDLDAFAPSTGARKLPPLLEFIPEISPHLCAPLWLQQITDLFERANRGERVRAVVSCPPQHGKSTIGLHALPWFLAQNPHKSALYLSYNDSLATTQLRVARSIARVAQAHGYLHFHDAEAQTEWQFSNGARLRGGGILGGITGYPGNLILVDDPHKNWTEAQSKALRDKVHNEFQASITTRAHPDTSIVVIQTRWHKDDLAGRLVKKGGWEEVNLPAINRKGEALWEEGRPLDFLLGQKASLHSLIWEALYQGNPTDAASGIFGDPVLCTLADLPINPAATGYGIDLSYSAKTSSDYSAIVKLALDIHGQYYVADVVKVREPTDKFQERLKARSVPYHWRCSGVEEGTADLYRASGIRIVTTRALNDKLTNALPFAQLWNAGKISVPADASWSDDYIAELTDFTGDGSGHDDQVDASVSALDASKPKTVGYEGIRVKGRGRRR